MIYLLEVDFMSFGVDMIVEGGKWFVSFYVIKWFEVRDEVDFCLVCIEVYVIDYLVW